MFGGLKLGLVADAMIEAQSRMCFLTLRDEIVQVGEPCEKRLLASLGMMKAFYGAQLPLDGIMRLSEQGARHGHLRVCEHRVPACLLVLHPTPYPLAIGRPCRGGDM